MAEIKELTEKQLTEIISQRGFSRALTIKDYYIAILLYLMKDIKDIYFKGGTCLQMTLLNHARISEDIDFTIENKLSIVKSKIKETINSSKIFGNIKQDKDVEGFVRLVVPYKSILGEDQIFIDLNERGNILTRPKKLLINHFYPNIPSFYFSCLSQEEMVAEKVVAAIKRNKPRDHHDIYQIIKNKIPINMDLVKEKCKQSGDDPSIIKMFNKAKKLHKKWKSDMLPLLVEEVSFKEVMQTLSNHFKLKDEKEKLKR